MQGSVQGTVTRSVTGPVTTAHGDMKPGCVAALETLSAHTAAAARRSLPLVPGLRPKCAMTGTWEGTSYKWQRHVLGAAGPASAWARPSSPVGRVFVVFVVLPGSRKAHSGPWPGSQSAGGPGRGAGLSFTGAGPEALRPVCAPGSLSASDRASPPCLLKLFLVFFVTPVHWAARGLETRTKRSGLPWREPIPPEPAQR